MSSSLINTNSTSANSTYNSNKKANNQNKLYTKEINSLIDKIIKSKRSTLHFSKLHQFNGSNPGNNQNNLNNISHEIKNKLFVENRNNLNQKLKNNLSQSQNNSSINEPNTLSLLNANLNSKVSEFSKLLSTYLDNNNENKNITMTKQEKAKLSCLISEMLRFIKMEKDIGILITDHDEFLAEIIDFISSINFSHVKYYPNYKITDSSYNNVEVNISKKLIEEYALNETTGENSGPSVIRIKRDNWQDILNLYNILIILLNYTPTTNVLISKLPLEFISNLVQSLQTLDNEERTLIKIVIYKIYVSSLTYRKFILKNISNNIIDITRDNKNNIYCLDECLDLIRCIILGAKKPINAKYLYVVTDVVCPLLKCKGIYKQDILKQTLFKFMAYDKILLSEIVQYLLKTWPVRYPDRIIVYLDILENIFTKNLYTNLEEKLLNTIFSKVKFCFSDLSFLIADRSLVFFKNENFISCLYQYNLQGQFLKKLVNNIATHWSQEIKIISKIVISRLTKRDSAFLKNLTEQENEIINGFKFDVTDNEDIWDIQYNLKGD